MRAPTPAYAAGEMAADFTQSAVRAGFRGRRRLTVLAGLLAVGMLRPGGVSNAGVSFWTGSALTLWWLAALWCLPPTRPLWRYRRPGIMRHAAPVIAALAPARLACRAALAALLWACAPLDGVGQVILRALAAWGALMLGHGLCMALLVRVRPGRMTFAVSLLVLTAQTVLEAAQAGGILR